MDWMEIEMLFLNSANEIRTEDTLDKNKAKLILEQLKIDPYSVLGQILVHYAGIIINGYLRFLGGEEKGEHSGILSFNKKVKECYDGKKLIVAHDIWGGLFAISNGDFEGDIRNIWYFAPDSLDWENLNIYYSQFVVWACDEKVKKFYQNFLWNQNERLIEKIEANQAVLMYPFLWASECEIEKANKKIVPIAELISLNANLQKAFNN
ncbi:MAG: DUF2625 domain-containing protein [Lachnoclostridium sp.]|jgi:hypothetical protein|nr:DUF2625 domain-containing protein [Lachnoclostridium sp.]